jgi:hypothetical protein
MTQFDPSMVAQMLMQPIQRATENLGGGPFGIGADAGGSYFVDPEVAARTGYGTAVTGTSFFPGAGIVDAYGGAVDVTGQPLPSFGENISQGQFTDAGLQALGVAGDIATIAAPLTLGTSALVGAILKAPGAIRKTTNVADVASDVGSITRSSTLNEKGFDTDLVLYHGSSKPLKSVNDQRGLYLSPSSDVASYYTNPSYSAAAKSAGDFEEPAPNITPVHIKTEQIFDTRKPEHRKIFQEKFLNSYGNQTGIGEKGLPDWTDGEDFKEFFENENLPFKGVILDEGGFLDEGGEVVDRGVSYAIFDKDSVTPVLSDFDNVEVTPPTETKPGIIAFHGSGADFDEFKLDKIGTGEGGRSFGYGLNFSDSEDIAKFYKNKIGGDEGKTYKVAVEPKPEELLDYDLPLSEQPKILEKLENTFGAKELNVLSLKNAGVNSEKLTGRRLYKLLKDEYGNDKLASEKLSKSGIKGSKYKPVTLDKPNPKETNFVIFDDKIIKVLEKYGIVGPVAVSATAAALRDDDGSS